MTLINFFPVGIVHRVPAVEALTPRLLADTGLDRYHRGQVGSPLLACFDLQTRTCFRTADFHTAWESSPERR